MYDNIIHGSLVKRLRRRPLTAETRVRFPYGLLSYQSSVYTDSCETVVDTGFLFFIRSYNMCTLVGVGVASLTNVQYKVKNMKKVFDKGYCV